MLCFQSKNIGLLFIIFLTVQRKTNFFVNLYWNNKYPDSGLIYDIKVSRFGLPVRRQAGKQRDLGSKPLRLSFLFKGCGLWTLSCDFVPLN